MEVRDVMTSPAVTVGPETPLHAVIEEILRQHIGSVVVVDAGPIGILTRTDVLRLVYRTGGSVADRTAREVMSEDLVSTRPSTAIGRALETMESHGIKRLPVSEDLELVGIVTMTDIARHQPDRVREVRETIERRTDWTD